MKISEKSGKKKIILAVVMAILAVFIIAYLALGMFFQNHFWFRTTINGVKCSGKSAAEVEKTITEEITGYQIILQERESQTEVIYGKDIALSPEFDGSLTAQLASRSGFGWIVSLFQKTDIQLETMVNFDEEQLASQIEHLECVKLGESKAPKDAYLSEYENGTGYSIIPEDEGAQIDEEALKKVISNAIINLQDQISLEEHQCYIEPAVRAESEELVALQEKMNGYVQMVVTYEFGSDTETLKGETIQKWVSVSEDNQVEIDAEQAKEFITELASKYNTAGKSRSLATSYGTTVNISPNEYGWKIDVSGELEQLLADLEAGENISREPIYSRSAKSYGTNDHGGTYVEINLTAQHLYFYKDGALVVESDFVSGNISKGNGTPSGAYAIAYTQKDAILRGEDYRTPVSFWMPFNGGVGLHDATWRSDFGGNYYKTNGSHGCINLPYSVAKTIFNNISSGDAVFVYELPGTESQKAKDIEAAAAITALIDSIGNVDWNSYDTLTAARSGYDALTEQGKGYVKNYAVLVNAENVYAGMLASAQAQNEAAVVVDAINGIGEVTLEKKAAVESARAMYQALPQPAKTFVTNLSVLEAAETKLAELALQ